MIDTSKLEHAEWYCVLTSGEWRVMKWSNRFDNFRGAGMAIDVEPSEVVEVRGPITPGNLPLVTQAKDAPCPTSSES